MNNASSQPTKGRLLAGSLLLLLAASAHAVPLHYEIGSGSVTANTAEPGLVIGTSVQPTVAGTSFTLDNNQSFTLAFFSIWTNEPTINADDLVASTISATLNFTDPFTGATVNGITVGGKYFKGLSQWGQLTWNGPVTITLAGDRTFQLSLTDATFNAGYGGLNEGALCGAEVSATITQISSVAPPEQRPPSVPENGKTAFLLGTALVALRLLARNRTNRGRGKAD